MTNATPASAPQTVYIQVADDSGTRQTYALTPAGLMVGEFSGCQIQLSGPGIARNHLWVKYAAGEATVRPLTSEYPVWLNEQALAPGQNHVWPLQQPLTIGRYRLTLTPTAMPPLTQAEATLPSMTATTTANAAAIAAQAGNVLDATQSARSIQLASDPVGIELAPGDERLSITPGHPVNVPVILHNRRSAAEQVQIILSGLPGSNYSIDPAEIDLAPNARQPIDVRVSLPEAPAITPGERAVTILAKSLTAPDVSSQRQVTWVVKRFLKKPNVQITPSRQMISSLQTFFRRDANRALGANYNVQIENLSNEREFYTIRVENNDPSISCSLRETNKSLGPGEKGAASLWVEPLADLESQRRLSSFRVVVQPDSQPAPEPQLGHLEHVTPAYALRRIAPILALAGMIGLLLAGFFFLVRPWISSATNTETPTSLPLTALGVTPALSPAPPPDLGPLQQAAAATTTALAAQAQTAQNVDAGVRATQDAFATTSSGTSFAIATAFQATNVVIGTLQADATKGVGNAGATVAAIYQQQTATMQVAGAISQTGTALALQLAPTQTTIAAGQTTVAAGQTTVAQTQAAIPLGQTAAAQTQAAQPNPALTAAAVLQEQVAQTQTAIASITPQVPPPNSVNAAALKVGLQTLNVAAGDTFTMTVSVLDKSFRLLPVNDIPIQIKLDQDVAAGLGLNGITTVNTKDGVASFTKLFIGKAGNFIIQASSPVLPNIGTDQTNSIVVQPGRVQSLTVNLLDRSPISNTLTQSSVFTLTKTFTVTVNLSDRFGNPATNANNSVNLAVVQNTGDLNTVADVVSFSNQIFPVNGTATFSDFVPKTYEPGKEYRIKATYNNGSELLQKSSDKFRIDRLISTLSLNVTSYPFRDSVYGNSDIKPNISVINPFCNDPAHLPELSSSNPSSLLNAGSYTVVVRFPPDHTKCQGSSQFTVTITPKAVTYNVTWNGSTAVIAITSPNPNPQLSEFEIVYRTKQPDGTFGNPTNTAPTLPGEYQATATLKPSASNYTATSSQTTNFTIT